MSLITRLLQPFRPQSADRAHDSLREDIADAIAASHSEGGMGKEHRDRLLGALDLADRTVDEIMRHRSKVEMIDADAPSDAIISQVLASTHSRLPVYRGNSENILGVVHAKDLWRETGRGTWATCRQFAHNA